jgi:hypothetical protein
MLQRLVGANQTSALSRSMGAIKMAIKKTRESSPLWVWLVLAMLALGGIGYVTVVSIVEYLMAASS